MEGGGKKRQLGKILLKQKLVTPDELDNLLEHQREAPDKRLASTAKEAGTLAGEDLLRALAEQYGSPAMDLDQVVIPLDNLKLIPVDIARQHTILPVVVKHDRLFLAMADPSDRRVIDEIEFVTGRRVFPYVALHDTLTTTLEQAYAMARTGEDYYIGPNVPKDYLVAHGIAADSEPPAAAPQDPRPAPAAGSSWRMRAQVRGATGWASMKEVATSPQPNLWSLNRPPPGASPAFWWWTMKTISDGFCGASSKTKASTCWRQPKGWMHCGRCEARLPT